MSVISTQAEFDAAIAAGQTDLALALSADIIVRAGDPTLRVNDGQPRVVASGSSQLSVSGAVNATATDRVAVLIEGVAATVNGGQQTRVMRSTVEQWCAYYGVPIRDGVVVLYKAVGDDFHTVGQYRFAYTPGTTPVAPDWDGGVKECGGGLHFSPRPLMARRFASEATKYVACPVAVSDIVVYPNGQAPEKVKARGCCAPVWACDEDGEVVSL